MIIFNQDYSFEKDKYQWILHHSYDGKDKKGNPKRHTRDTYHATLEQICGTIINREAGECESMGEIRFLLDDAVRVLTDHVVTLDTKE